MTGTPWGMWFSLLAALGKSPLLWFHGLLHVLNREKEMWKKGNFSWSKAKQVGRPWAVDLLEKNKLSPLKEKIWTGCRVYWCLWLLCCCGCYFPVKCITAVPRHNCVACALMYTLVLKPSSYFGEGCSGWRLCFSSEREGKKIVGLQFSSEFLLSSGLGDIFRSR